MVMAMTLFFAAPMTVYAATDWTINPGGGADYTSLDALLADVASSTITLNTGDSITLRGGPVTGSTQFLIDGISITLNLGGNNLTINTTGAGDDSAINIYSGGSLTVEGTGVFTATANNTSGLYISDGAFTATGGAEVDITGTSGIYINNNGTVSLGSLAKINATGTGTSLYGVYTGANCTASVTSASAGGSNGIGVRADGSGSVIAVENDVISTGSNGLGVNATSGGQVFVYGSIEANTYGAIPDNGSQITVDGTITAPSYISVGGVTKTITDFAPVIPASRPTYIEYNGGTPLSYVWVKGLASTTNAQHFGTWTGTGTANGKSNEDETYLEALALNGVALTADTDFTTAPGSTLFTLTPAFLSSLANGSYTFRAFFYTGTAPVIYTDLTLTVLRSGGTTGGSGSGANGVPQTNDINNTLGWTVVLAFVILGIFGLMAWRRRQGAQE